MARKNEKTESGKERFVAVRKNNEGNPVSYTHLDVYKRQVSDNSCR